MLVGLLEARPQLPGLDAEAPRRDGRGEAPARRDAPGQVLLHRRLVQPEDLQEEVPRRGCGQGPADHRAAREEAQGHGAVERAAGAEARGSRQAAGRRARRRGRGRGLVREGHDAAGAGVVSAGKLFKER